jgi:hypothetical protein
MLSRALRRGLASPAAASAKTGSGAGRGGVAGAMPAPAWSAPARNPLTLAWLGGAGALALYAYATSRRTFAEPLPPRVDPRLFGAGVPASGGAGGGGVASNYGGKIMCVERGDRSR